MQHIQNRPSFISLLNIDFDRFTKPIINIARRSLGFVSGAFASVAAFFLRLLAGDGPKLSLKKARMAFEKNYVFFVTKPDLVPKPNLVPKKDDYKIGLMNSLIRNSEEFSDNKKMANEQDLNEDESFLVHYARSSIHVNLLTNFKKINFNDCNFYWKNYACNMKKIVSILSNDEKVNNDSHMYLIYNNFKSRAIAKEFNTKINMLLALNSHEIPLLPTDIKQVIFNFSKAVQEKEELEFAEFFFKEMNSQIQQQNQTT